MNDYELIKTEYRNSLISGGIPEDMIIYQDETAPENADIFIRESLINGSEIPYTNSSTSETCLLEYDIFEKKSAIESKMFEITLIFKSKLLYEKVFTDERVRIRRREIKTSTDDIYRRYSIILYLEIV